MNIERRRIHRVPVELFLNEYVGEQEGRALVTNLSDTGLFVHRILRPVLRRDGLMQFEFALPGTAEVIWAAGQARYDVLDGSFHGTGVHFVAIAQAHRRMIRQYVSRERARRLRQRLDRIRRGRQV